MKTFDRKLSAILAIILLLMQLLPVLALAEAAIGTVDIDKKYRQVIFLDEEGQVIEKFLVNNGTDITSIAENLASELGEGIQWRSDARQTHEKISHKINGYIS